MATEDFTDCLFSETESMVDVQVLDYSNYTLKDEADEAYDDSTDDLIVSDSEQTNDFKMEDIAPHLGPNTLTLITLPDGSQAYVGAHDLEPSMTDVHLEDEDDPTLHDEDNPTLLDEDDPPLCNELVSDGCQQILLDEVTIAMLHSSPKDDGEQYQAVTMEDGTTTYISLSDLARTISATNAINDGQLCDDTAVLSEEPQTLPTEVVAKEKAAKCHQCPILNCGKLYTTTHHLKVHQRAHTGDRPFRCPEEGCNKAFATGYGCKAHVRTHTGEKPYKCPDSACHKCFKTSGDLQKHIRVHTGERPFLCQMPDCGRSFTTSNIRKVHFRTHTGERPYTCSFENCGRAFASATNYKNHMRIHSGEKPYQCSAPGCEKRFTEYSSLYKHNLVHTQQKPYQCTVCERSYRQASTLTMHKRTAHGIVETDDGTEIILGETVFTLADTDGGGKRLKALGSNVLGIRDGNRIVQVNHIDTGPLPQQFLVVADSAQITAFQELELGCTSFLDDMETTVEEDDIASDSLF